MQKRKHINLLFIWLTGLMFFTHGITPHHHHFDSVFEHSQQAGHADEHSEDNPLHCHAFNDLTIDKAGISSNRISFVPLLLAVIAEGEIQQQTAGQAHGLLLFSHGKDGTTTSGFLINSPTRGSPQQI